MSSGFSTKQIDYDNFNQSVKFEIWDTAGQEKYKSINKMFYRDAAIAILVYDITRKLSFEEIKNYWVNELNEQWKMNRIFLGIAANKIDLYEYQEVSEDTGRELAEQYNAVFRQTSAKNSSGIDVKKLN